MAGGPGCPISPAHNRKAAEVALRRFRYRDISKLGARRLIVLQRGRNAVEGGAELGAQRLHADLEGSGEAPVRGVADIRDAGPDDISFVGNPKYVSFAANTRAAALIVPNDLPVEKSEMLCKPVAGKPSAPLPGAYSPPRDAR